MTIGLDFKYRSLTPDDVREMRLGDHFRLIARQVEVAIGDQNFTTEQLIAELHNIVNTPIPDAFDLAYAQSARWNAVKRKDYDVADLWQIEINRLQGITEIEDTSDIDDWDNTDGFWDRFDDTEGVDNEGKSV